MKWIMIVVAVAWGHYEAGAQTKTLNPAFEQSLNAILTFPVPVISVPEFKKMTKNEEVVILDTRECAEYNVSHIAGARRIGFHQLDLNVLNDVPKHKTILLYCTEGIRSEQVGARLQKLGYKNVHNLLGGVIEWANRGERLVDKSGKPTKEVFIHMNTDAKWLQCRDCVPVTELSGGRN